MRLSPISVLAMLKILSYLQMHKIPQKYRHYLIKVMSKTSLKPIFKNIWTIVEFKTNVDANIIKTYDIVSNVDV